MEVWRHKDTKVEVEVTSRERTPEGQTRFLSVEDGVPGSMKHADFNDQFEEVEGNDA